MPQHVSPRQVVEALMQGITDARWHELHHYYADNAVVEYPFGLPKPSRLEGIDTIRNYFATVSGFSMRMRARNMVVHETTDPDVVIAEWDYDVTVTTTHRAFSVSNIQVTTVRNGKIVASRDYHNHFAMAEALGRLPALLAALEKG